MLAWFFFTTTLKTVFFNALNPVGRNTVHSNAGGSNHAEMQVQQNACLTRAVPFQCAARFEHDQDARLI
jgi:hypothetical protein